MKTYGSVDLKDHHWHVKCDPSVAVRLKRTFEQIHKGDHGTILLANSIANSRELLWFLDRFPMKLAPGCLEELTRQSDSHKAQEALVASVLDGSYEPAQFDLAVPARDYQRLAADLLLRTGRLLLGDALGTGKTASAICAMTDQRALPALVVTATHLTLQWKAEIAKFAPNLRTHIIKTGKNYNLCTGPKGSLLPFPDVIIINYAKLSKWSDVLGPIVNYVVYDEIQELRNDGTLKYKGAEYISSKATFKIGLSATPVTNYGSDIFRVLNVLEKDCLGTKEEFIREYCKYSHDEKKAQVNDPRALGHFLRHQGLMLRRTLRDIGRELPPISVIPHLIDADLKALEKVEKSVAELAKIILSQGGMGIDKLKAGGEMDMRLRQATGIAKASYAVEFIKLLLETEEKVVVFAWHHEVHRILRDGLKDFRPVMYTGQESTVQKEASKKAFVDGNSRVIILSIRSGAGLDGLQHVCKTTVHVELDWSRKFHEQADGRIYRDGQPDPVFAYYLISEHGSDPVISDIINLKQQQAEGIVNPDGELLEAAPLSEDRMKLLAESVLKKHPGVDNNGVQ